MRSGVFRLLLFVWELRRLHSSQARVTAIRTSPRAMGQAPVEVTDEVWPTRAASGQKKTRPGASRPGILAQFGPERFPRGQARAEVAGSSRVIRTDASSSAPAVP